MTKIIPRKLIKHLEWTPEQEAPQRTPINPSPQPVQQKKISIDALINNEQEPFYSNERDSDGKYIGAAVALQEAYDQVGSEGVIATMPYHIAGKAQAEKSNYLWQDWFTTLTEENTGIDKNGKLVDAGQSVVVTVHGEGILTPERIRQAYNDGLTPQNTAQYTEKEFQNLLSGVLPSGSDIDLYTVDDVKNGSISNPFGRYAVWMPIETAKATKSGYHQKGEFMENPLVLARTGTLEYLEAYFDKAKHSGDQDVNNSHRLEEIDFRVPQGRLLFLYYDFNGLSGDDDLVNDGRFVGVAPEARSARK